MISLVVGVFAGICGLIGAVLAAHALDTGIYTFGLGLIGFAVIMNFWLVKLHFDTQERARSL